MVRRTLLIALVVVALLTGLRSVALADGGVNGKGKKNGQAVQAQKSDQIQKKAKAEKAISKPAENADNDDNDSEGMPKWRTLPGTVTGVTEKRLTIQLASGKTYHVQGRTVRYLWEKGFTPAVGHVVTVTVIGNAGTASSLGAILDNTNGQAVQVRDPSGKPEWATQ
jgi:hypothetical protein